MASDTTVHNPPKGGPQDQASTNDDNINGDLHGRPWVAAISDGETVGVLGRYSSQSEADAAAKAFKAKRPQKRIEVRALKENDPKNGLPAFVAEVAAEFSATDEADDAKPAKK